VYAWDEFFHAEHPNPHTRRAYLSAVKRFLTWAEAQGVFLAKITPGMVGQYLVGLGGSPSKRNLHLSALRGFSASIRRESGVDWAGSML
jgi:hypothetical protein